MLVSILRGMTDVTVEEFTIDELAARTGTTVRTIRFYNESGLLPPAERRGRLAYYGAPHRIRLELVQQLQQHGYTLAAITKVLARLPEGATAHDLAVRAALSHRGAPPRTRPSTYVNSNNAPVCRWTTGRSTPWKRWAPSGVSTTAHSASGSRSWARP